MSTNRGLYSRVGSPQLNIVLKQSPWWLAASLLITTAPYSSIILLKGHFISLIEFPVELSFSTSQPAPDRLMRRQLVFAAAFSIYC